MIINLDEFTRGYIECAMWTTTVDDEIDAYLVSDITDETLEQMAADCKDFQEKVGVGNIQFALAQGVSMGRMGHCFWLVRDGHGSGFMDDYKAHSSERMTKVAQSYKQYTLEVGDDGKIYGR